MTTKQETEVPNLDCMNEDELWAFYVEYHKCGYHTARKLFPTKPKHYVRAARDLSAYACNKSVAMQQRLKGKIATAIQYEDICDRIHIGLPYYATW